MSNENKPNHSNLPFAIIGLVLFAALVGGWYLYQNSKAAPVKTALPGNTNKKKDDTSALQAYRDAPPGAQPANILGSPTATVTVEEFADFQCPTCAAVHPKMKEINALYGSRIKYIYRNFPLPMHQHGYEAAVAAEAAGMQGKYWEMQNQLFPNQQAWANAADARKIFSEYAQKLGLDVNKFETDMLGLPAKSRVDLDLERGRALNVNSTPTIYINGKQIPFEQFDVAPMRQVIDAELQKAQSGAPQPNPTDKTSKTNSNVAVVVPSNSGVVNK